MIPWIGVLLALVVGWGLISARRMLRPAPQTLASPDPFPPVTTLSLTSHDGTIFDARLFEASAPRGVLLVCHGYRANWLQLIALADALRRRGYAVMAMNLRGHGDRPGPCTFGIRDRQDLEAILAWRSRQPALASLPVGMLGWSLGGAIACQVAAQQAQVKALVLDSTFAKLFPIAARVVKVRYHLPVVPFAWITWAGVQLALRRNLSALDPLRLAPRLRIPLLWIHGQQDQVVSTGQGEALFAAWPDPKERWSDPRADHVGTYALQPEEYATRVAQFFDRWLGSHA